MMLSVIDRIADWWQRHVDEVPDVDRIRPQYGRCPGCNAYEEHFCFIDCSMLDPLDWR